MGVLTIMAPNCSHLATPLEECFMVNLACKSSADYMITKILEAPGDSFNQNMLLKMIKHFIDRNLICESYFEFIIRSNKEPEDYQFQTLGLERMIHDDSLPSSLDVQLKIKRFGSESLCE